MLQGGKMTGKKRFIGTVVLTGVLLLTLVYGLNVWQHKYSADSETIKFDGIVFVDQVDTVPAMGATVKLVTSDDLCDVKEYSTVADQQGKFSITINNFCACPYKIIAGGDSWYNAVDNGSVYLMPNPPSMPIGIEDGKYKLVTNSEVDLMKSNYNGSLYLEGYNGAYLLSQWDFYYLRNKVSASQLTEPMSPSKASFTIPIENITPLDSLDEFQNEEDKTHVILYIGAVFDDWNNRGAPDSTIPITKQYIVLDKNLKEVKFDVDLSQFTKFQRYKAWLNGFKINFGFDDRPEYALDVEKWKNKNQALWIPRSEDGTPPSIAYSGFEKTTEKRPGIVTPTAMPVDNVTLNSDFAHRPAFPKNPCHRGIDFAASTGDNIHAAAAGRVMTAEFNGGFGLHIVIRHCNNMYTWYGHLLPGSILVNPGEWVNAGQQIASADNTGLSSGSHLHFSVAYKGKDNYVDPFLDFPDAFNGGIGASNYHGKDAEKRKEILSKDQCVMEKGWIYDYNLIN